HDDVCGHVWHRLAGPDVWQEEVAAQAGSDTALPAALLRPYGRIQWLQHEAAWDYQPTHRHSRGHIHRAGDGQAGWQPGHHPESLHRVWQREPGISAVHGQRDRPLRPDPSRAEAE